MYKYFTGVQGVIPSIHVINTGYLRSACFYFLGNFHFYENLSLTLRISAFSADSLLKINLSVKFSQKMSFCFQFCFCFLQYFCQKNSAVVSCSQHFRMLFCLDWKHNLYDIFSGNTKFISFRIIWTKLYESI
jgi:hypothetical protein